MNREEVLDGFEEDIFRSFSFKYASLVWDEVLSLCSEGADEFQVADFISNKKTNLDPINEDLLD